MFDDSDEIAPPGRTEPVEAPGPEPSSDDAPPFGSLAEDVGALYEDGKTYVEAELAYQRTRATYAGTKTKQGLVFGLGALAFLHLALIGLVIGLIIALEPWLTAFGSTALVVGVLLVGCALLARRAMKRFDELGAAFSNGSEASDEHD